MAIVITEQMEVQGNVAEVSRNGRNVQNGSDGTMTIYSAGKIPQILVGPDPETGNSVIKLYSLDGVEQISIGLDANNVAFLRFANNEGTEIVRVDAGDTPHLAFKNTSGQTMLKIGLTGSAANPLIEMDSASGVKQITMGVDSTAGQSNVSVYSASGVRQAYMGIDPKAGTQPVIAATQSGTDVVTELKK